MDAVMVLQTKVAVLASQNKVSADLSLRFNLKLYSQPVSRSYEISRVFVSGTLKSAARDALFLK
jgi:hypothetical protein